MTIIQILLIVFSVSVFDCSGMIWDDLEIKYGLTDGGYWKMPLSVNEIKIKTPQEFLFVERDTILNVDLYSHFQDPRFFLLFDTYGNIAGVRIGYMKADIETKYTENNLTFLYNFEEISMFKEGRFWDKYVWYTSVLFVNPEKLNLGGRKDTMGKVAEGLYAILDRKWVEVARDESNAEEQGFTKQACFPGMGSHYFYKLTPTLDCKEYQPFFALYDFGQLIGFGLSPFGMFLNKDGGQKWYESIPVQAITALAPRAPQCLYDWYDKFGSATLHIFLKKDAKKTFCPKFSSLECYILYILNKRQL